jgi:dipeptidyl aminopeptidase/acylaminoacyl peptidase
MSLRAAVALALFLISNQEPRARGRAVESPVPSSGRHFEVKDSIEMVRFKRVGGEPEFSPDKKYFAVVTSRGLLQSNEIESTLWIFASDEVRESLRVSGARKQCVPRMLVRMAAIPQVKVYDSYEPLISDLKWLPDSNTILFLGQNSQGMRQLRQVELSSGVLRTLTPEGYDVIRFASAGGNTAYAAPPTESRHAGAPINSDAWDVTGAPLRSLLFPETASRRDPDELVVVSKGRNVRVSDPNTGEPVRMPKYPPSSHSVLSVSSDGRTAIILTPSKTIPPSWELYEPVFPYLKINSKDTNTSAMLWPSQYAAVDMSSGKTAVLLSAPNGWALGYGDVNQAVWSSNGKKLLLTNTFLPLDGVDEQERSRRLHPCTAAMTDLSGKESTCVVFSSYDRYKKDLISASFGESDEEVVLRFWNAPNTTTEERYRSNHGRWQSADRRTNQERGAADHPLLEKGEPDFSLSIRQDLNTSPALWATDRKTGQSRKIWDPNPQLTAFHLGEASEFRWKDKTGYEWTAGLVKPPDYLPGKRYPLVIQTHGFEQDEFITDGEYTTAFAARPLASAGIVVLQMPTRRDRMVTADEASEQIEGFRSAIDRLAAAGLIDPVKVGIIGFSRTCYYVESALIRDPGRFAAATIADGVDESYMQFLLFGLGESQNEAVQMYGTSPFGDGLKAWMEHAPGFHLDRIETPVRIEAITPESILQEWEIYASLTKQKKLVDLVYLPDGQHILQKPLERLASQQGNVDWFRFWLKGEEDGDPSKAKQYALWRQFRRQSLAENGRP